MKTQNPKPHLATDDKMKKQLACVFGLERVHPKTEYPEFAFKELPVWELDLSAYNSQKILGVSTPSGFLFYFAVKVQDTCAPRGFSLEIFGTYPFALSLVQIPLVSSQYMLAGKVLGK